MAGVCRAMRVGVSMQTENMSKTQAWQLQDQGQPSSRMCCAQEGPGLELKQESSETVLTQ